MSLSNDEVGNVEYLKRATHEAKSVAAYDDCDVQVISKIGVVGAGTMGKGIALNAVLSGFDVTLLDASPHTLEQAAQWVQSRIERAKGKGASARHACPIGGFVVVHQMEALSACDLVIEAVPENLGAKRSVFNQLDVICRDGAILASNTSTLNVDLIAKATKRPQDVIGLHFFSPAHVMRLLEIVPTKYTSRNVMASAFRVSQALGKVGVKVGNCYGFVGNRMIEGFSREANLLVLEGNSPVDIDAALKTFGFAMGALEVADLVGIDVPYAARMENKQKSDDPTYYRIADMLVAEGMYGQKSGLGYYEYLPDGAKRLNPRIREMVAMEAKRLNVPQKKSSPERIVERCVFPLINEGAKILEEGIAEQASDLDVIMTLGYGFPSSLGGPMRYADNYGLSKVLNALRRLQDECGDIWAPASLIEACARTKVSLSGVKAGELQAQNSRKKHI